MDIRETVQALPHAPGVYIFHQGDQILYIGKAVDLHNRVRQYFQEGADGRPLIVYMVEKIDSLEYIVTASEMEAFVLENNLIKEHKPPYNTLLKDDKRYPYIKVSVKDAFPRILKVHQPTPDGSRYFGPYTNGAALAETLRLMKELWPLRSCDRVLPRDIDKERPCLNQHIGRCLAPCSSACDAALYQQYVAEAIELLEGHPEKVKARLKAEMAAASSALNFEQAALLRDRLAALEQLSEHQNMENAGSDQNMDCIALATKEPEGTLCMAEVFFIRSGKILGREHFVLEVACDDAPADIMSSFIRQFYSGTALVPAEIITSCDPSDLGLIREYLGGLCGKMPDISAPKRGRKAELIRMAQENALISLEQFGEQLAQENKRTRGAVEELGAFLGFSAGELSRIEAYDISNTFGYCSVGSMVVFEDGRPKKSDYRKFRIKTIVGADDFHSLAEVLTRRFTHGIKDFKEAAKNGEPVQNSFTRFPQLILMDGGRGQVNAARAVLADLGLDIAIAGMVKDDKHRTRALFYNDKEYAFSDHPEVFHLITRIQDEAHRFAITFHRSLRDGDLSSVLDEIEGVGPKRRDALLREFGSVGAIRDASFEELTQSGMVPEAVAGNIYHFFHKEDASDV